MDLLINNGNDPDILESIVLEKKADIIEEPLTIPADPVAEPISEVEIFVQSFKKNDTLDNMAIYIQVLKTGGFSIDLLEKQLAHITFDTDDFGGIWNECAYYRASAAHETDTVYYHLDIFTKLLSTYLKYAHNHTYEEICSIFMRKDIKNKILAEAARNNHWYVVKYLLKTGADFINDDDHLYDFLYVRRNQHLLTYILDNSLFNIEDYRSVCNAHHARWISIHKRYAGCGYTMNDELYRANFTNQMKYYLIHLRYKMIFINKLTYPVDMAIDSHSNAIVDILSYIRKLYVLLHQKN